MKTAIRIFTAFFFATAISQALSVWSPQVSGTMEWLYSVHFTDANTGWAVGTGGAIVNTIDGGATWTPQPSGTTQILNSVHFTDANTGYAVGANGTILKYGRAAAIAAKPPQRIGLRFDGGFPLGAVKIIGDGRALMIDGRTIRIERK